MLGRPTWQVDPGLDLLADVLLAHDRLDEREDEMLLMHILMHIPMHIPTQGLIVPQSEPLASDLHPHTCCRREGEARP